MKSARIVDHDRRAKLKYQFVDLNYLHLEGWINYLDILTVGNYQKSMDLAANKGQNKELRAGVQHRRKENQRVSN